MASITSIVQGLGKGTSRPSIVSSAAFVFTCFFYVFTIASYFKVPIYFLHSRVVSKLYFADAYVISKDIDHLLIVSGIVIWLFLSVRGSKTRFVTVAFYAGIAIIGVLTNLAVLVDFAALISIPLVICFLIYNRYAPKKILNTNSTLYANYFSVMGICLGIVGFIISAALPLFSITSTPIPNYAYGIFVLFSSFSPVLMILLISAVPVKVLTMEFLKGISKRSNAIGSLVISHDKIKRRKKVVYLSLIVLLTLALVSIPHQPTVNKSNRLIGADSTLYVGWVNPLIKSNDPQEFIKNAFVTVQAGDRPIALIFLFTIIKLTAIEPSYVIDHIPLILGPALVVVIYFLTRELTSNDTISLFASFLTAVSFHTLVGLYAGYYANWFALILGYLSFVFIFRFLKSSRKVNLIIYFFMTIIVLFSHAYTWTILTTVMGIFLLVMLGFHYYPRRSLILLLIVVSCSVIIDVTKTTITGSSGGIATDIDIARTQEAGVGQLPIRWNNIIDTVFIYYGAAFSNVIILLLGLYWVFRSDTDDPTNIFLFVFLSIGILPLFFGNWLVQSRVFYNIPFQIPAAIALTYIKRAKYGSMIILPICIWLIAMSVRVVSDYV